MRVPTLRTDRLMLKPLDETHSIGMFALWSDPDVCRYSGPISDAQGAPIASPVQQASDSDRIISFWREAAAQGTGCRWALLLRRTASFIGAAGFNSLGETSEFAYHLLPQWWSKGLMTEATPEFFNWVKAKYGCREIEAFIKSENSRSIAFAERQGFSPDTTRHGSALRWSRPSTR